MFLNILFIIVSLIKIYFSCYNKYFSCYNNRLFIITIELLFRYSIEHSDILYLNKPYIVLIYTLVLINKV